jgi:hypothetical protein
MVVCVFGCCVCERASVCVRACVVVVRVPVPRPLHGVCSWMRGVCVHELSTPRAVRVAASPRVTVPCHDSHVAHDPQAEVVRGAHRSISVAGADADKLFAALCELRDTVPAVPFPSYDPDGPMQAEAAGGLGGPVRSPPPLRAHTHTRTLALHPLPLKVCLCVGQAPLLLACWVAEE